MKTLLSKSFIACLSLAHFKVTSKQATWLVNNQEQPIWL